MMPGKYLTFINRFSKTGQTGLIIVGIVFFMAIFAPLISVHSHKLSSGPPLSSPNGEHILGTDELGVDLWAQICFGSRISLVIGMGTALLAGSCGGLIGVLAAYSGGMTDRILMRIIDIITVLPDLPVMIVLAAFFGPGLINIIIVLSLFSWVATARIVRSQVLQLKEQLYIKSAETYGAGTWYLMKRHFLPEIFPLVAVSMIRLTGKAIVAEAGLSFLGLGDPASGSWGLIIHHATSFTGIYYTNFWKWWLIAPWIALTLMVSSLAFISRDFERFADPRMDRRKNRYQKQ
ncbi:MAG: ABC transporter permease [Desulfobacula sp.]|nr:ABC transporter permease [Desulfobacula sp.]